jgi:hypothetical protein
MNLVMAFKSKLAPGRGQAEQNRDHYADIQTRFTAWHHNLADKYAVTLHQLESARDDASARLAQHLKELGYD